MLIRLLCITLLVTFSCSVVHGGAHLDCNQPRFIFGQHDVGKEVNHTFLLFNSGDAPLTIKSVTPDCGCTTAKLETNRIGPGESVRLQATQVVYAGDQQRQIAVKTANPSQPTLFLSFEGVGVARVNLMPKTASFGFISPGETYERTVNLTVDEALRLHVQRWSILSGKEELTRYKGDDLTATVDRVSPETHYRIRLKLRAPDKMGRFDARVRLVTDCSAARVIDIPVSAIVAGALDYVPDQIVLQRGQMKPTTRYILIVKDQEDDDGRSFKITDVKAPSQLKMKLSPVGANAYRLRIDNLVALPDLDGSYITFETDVESMPTIRIPIRIAEKK